MKPAHQSEEANKDILPEQSQLLSTPTRSVTKATGVSLPNFNFANLLSTPSKRKEPVNLIRSQERKPKESLAPESPVLSNIYKNPFTKFYNDSNSKMIFEEN